MKHVVAPPGAFILASGPACLYAGWVSVVDGAVLARGIHTSRLDGHAAGRPGTCRATSL